MTVESKNYNIVLHNPVFVDVIHMTTIIKDSGEAVD